MVFYDKSLEINPDYVEALSAKAYALFKLKKFNKALKYYNKALKLDPNDEYSLKGREEVLKKIKNND